MASSEKFNLPPIDGPRADALLEHINTARWDRGRPAELLRLTAYLSAWPAWIPVKRRDIEAYLGRTPSEAHYDHKVMIRLASERVLQRTPRAGGDLWRINPDLRHWRGVPGIPSWRAVVSLFLDPLPQKTAPAGVNTAGQRLDPAGNTHDLMTNTCAPLSVGNYHPLAHNYHPLAHRPGKTSGEVPADGAVPGAATPFTSITPSSYVVDDDGKRLIKAVRGAIGAPAIYGAPAETLARLAVEHRSQIGRLEDLAHQLLVGCRAPSRAAEVLAQAVADGALDLPEPSGAGLYSLAARRRSLEAQISAWERAGADPEDIDRLKSQLEDLEGE